MPVRTIYCAGNNERTAKRITQHHVNMRYDGSTGCIGATLSVVRLLAIPLASCRSARAGSLRIERVARRRWAAFCDQEPHLSKVLASVGPGTVRDNS